jgi:hypothetical protein
MKNTVLWDVVPCSSYVIRHFGGTYLLRLQGRKIRERGTSVSRWLQTEPPVENTRPHVKTGKDGEWATWEINREKGGGLWRWVSR